jgi:serine/threonine protein kinase/tetratricopeptide (TPR) repeat protein
LTADEGQPSTLGAGRYRVVRELGAGGMGVVYEAIENASGAHVALKMLPAVDPHALFGFKNEFRSLAALVHTNLVSLYELVSENDTWFFTMELVDGVDFLRYVRKRPVSGPGDAFADLIDEQRLRAALVQLADGMEALHGNGVLHRDIKPPNVLVRRDGRVAILDFGLAMALDETLDTSEHSSGTLGYMSPEQLGGDPLGPASDWYAIGTMLYEALTGRPPFEGSPQQMFFAKAAGAAKPPREFVEGIPADLEALCLQMLHPDPAQRPDAAQVRARLAPESPVPAAVRENRDTRAFRLFVGRDDLLRRLESLLDLVRGTGTGSSPSPSPSPAGATAYVHGRSGAGKSALLEQFLIDARQDESVVVFSGRCYEQESVPFKAVDSIVDAVTRWLLRRGEDDLHDLLPADVAALARVFPVLERVPAIADAPREALQVPDPRELRRRAFRALRELLERIGRQTLVIAAIDDLQWGDVDSAELLASLLEPPNAPRLLLLLSFRSEYRTTSPCLVALDRALDGDASRRVLHDDIEVRPLDATTATMLAGALLTVRSGPVAARIAAEAAGNPFFIHELARYANANPGWIDRPGGGGFDLDRVVWERVERLPAAARTMLELVAIAGQPVRNAHWRDATGDVSVDPQSFALLRFEHLIRSTGSAPDDEVETYHDRIRETVASRTAGPVRTGHHRRLAVAMESHGDADAETIAVHFSRGGERLRAGVHFAVAAQSAEGKLAFDRAAGLYEQAISHRSSDDPERGPLHSALGRALGNAGRGKNAAVAYEVAASLATDRGERLDLQRQAATQYCTAGEIDRGRDLFARVMRGVGLQPTESSALIMLQLLGRRGRLRLRGLQHVERPESKVPPELLRRLDTLWAASTALSNVDVVRVAAMQSQALLLALRAGEPRRLALALGWEAVLNATSGTKTAKRSNELLALAAKLVERDPDPHARGMIHLSRGWIAFLHADFLKALRECDEAEPIFRDQCTGVWWELVLTRTMITWALSHCGLTADLAGRIHELEPEARAQGNHFMVTNLLAFPMPLERLLAGDPDAADAHADEAMRLWPYRGYHIQHVSVLFSRSLSLLYRGRSRESCEAVTKQWPAMLRSLQTQNQQTRVMLRDVRARAAVQAAPGGNATTLLARARRDLRSLGREGTGWTDAVAARLRGCIAIADGDPAGAIAAWRQALPGLESAGLAVQAAVLRRRLGETLGGDEGQSLVRAAETVLRERGIPDIIAVTRMYS